MASPIGIMSASAAAPAATRTSIISSVAYATEDSGSEENTGRASTFGSSWCSALWEARLCPSRNRFTMVALVISGASPESPQATTRRRPRRMGRRPDSLRSTAGCARLESRSMAVSTQSGKDSGLDVVKRILVGRRLASSRLEHTLLPKILALPVFSSDALSSVAYATEEILLVLCVASAAAAAPGACRSSIAIAALMPIVVISYRQTVRAYPSGGGAYIVSKDNLGTFSGLLAAAALLTDYVLTVAVSVVAGVFAITSAVPVAAPAQGRLSIGFVVLITLANLRGVRESGTLFAIPTYGFILSIFAAGGVGLVRCVRRRMPAGGRAARPPAASTRPAWGSSSSCTRSPPDRRR